AARRAGRRRAALEPRQLPPRDAQVDAVGHEEPGRQGHPRPVRRPPRRCGDEPLGVLPRGSRPAAHAAREHRLRHLRGQDDLRSHRRQGVDLQGRRRPEPGGARGPGGRAAPVAPRAPPAPRPPLRLDRHHRRWHRGRPSGRRPGGHGRAGRRGHQRPGRRWRGVRPDAGLARRCRQRERRGHGSARRPSRARRCAGARGRRRARAAGGRPPDRAADRRQPRGRPARDRPDPRDALHHPGRGL
ncbi:MAG: SSU ribosomal protein S3p (S3e), partial [uncultured Solirubrobacteraceae bacterium]